MKLVIAGATGFVATELIRQSLSIPKITSVIAIARHPVSTPSKLSPNADPSKLHSVIIENYGSYPEDVIKQLAGADACIWYVAPSISPKTPSINTIPSLAPSTPTRQNKSQQTKNPQCKQAKLKPKPKQPGPSQSPPGNRAVSPSTKSALSATTTPSPASPRYSKLTA